MDNYRLGKFSPSQFAAAMTNGRGKKNEPGLTALKLCRKIAMERLGVKPQELSLPSLDWGNENEPKAIERYENITGNLVIPTDYIQHSNVPYVCGTPDGLISDDGVIEVKCPYNPENHFENLYSGSQLDLYEWQGQGYLWITGRKWFDFVSFDPRYKYLLQIKIIRVERDQEKIDMLAERIDILENEVINILKQIEK